MGETLRVFNFSFALILFTVIYSNQNAFADRHVIVKRTLFSEPVKEIPGPEKNYTGYRVRRDSQLLLYHHEQTVGVVELGDNRELLNCELMEVSCLKQICLDESKSCSKVDADTLSLAPLDLSYMAFNQRMEFVKGIPDKFMLLKHDQILQSKDVWNSVKHDVKRRTKPDKVSTLASLRNVVSTQIKIPFSDMNDLMQYCQLLGHPIIPPDQSLNKKARQINTLDQRGFSSVFRGVYPGTKWCGAGDIAETYYDVGPQVELDKCCRTHDLCPVKVLGLRTQYNITNYTPYTRSHCDCDEIFYRCLKKVGTSSSNLLGTIYFNIARTVCVEDILDSMTTKVIGRRFTTRGIQF